jgi:epimerase transport system membrane fusion protein
MARSVTTYDPAAPQAGADRLPSDSSGGATKAGLAIILLFFGGLGGWAISAPLNAAIIGEAVVKVEGNRKSVQHLQGGIVKELRVKEGDSVREGDVLLVLDDTQTRAEFDILSQQQDLLKTTEARLVAELEGSDRISFPEDLLARRSDPSVHAVLDGQQKEFDSRKTALSGEEQILDQRIAQLREQIAGNEGQVASLQEQRKSVVDERAYLDDLFKKGLVTRPRLLQLERSATGLEGEIATTLASIASARQQIEEYTRQIAQLLKARMSEGTRDLSDTRAKLLDVAPRLHNARIALGRMEVRSPYAGKVVDLSVFSVGGVIGPGEKILDVVPERAELVVEAKIAVQDISELRPGMAAEVHFTSYKQRTVPLIRGTVAQVSADRLTDERTGLAYYLADVSVDQAELAASPEIRLYPGMPATVMVTTEERTALDYLLGPLVASLDQSFRQR